MVLIQDEGLYACDNCQFSTKNKSNLKAHRNAKHLGVKYPCDQCDYKASYSNHLRQHKRVKHEGVHFPCSLCLFTTSQKSKLKLHIREKHGERLELGLSSLLEQSTNSQNHQRSSIVSGDNSISTGPRDQEDTEGISSSIRQLEAQLGSLSPASLPLISLVQTSFIQNCLPQNNATLSSLSHGSLT